MRWTGRAGLGPSWRGVRGPKQGPSRRRSLGAGSGVRPTGECRGRTGRTLFGAKARAPPKRSPCLARPYSCLPGPLGSRDRRRQDLDVAGHALSPDLCIPSPRAAMWRFGVSPPRPSRACRSGPRHVPPRTPSVRVRTGRGVRRSPGGVGGRGPPAARTRGGGRGGELAATRRP